MDTKNNTQTSESEQTSLHNLTTNETTQLDSLEPLEVLNAKDTLNKKRFPKNPNNPNNKTPTSPKVFNPNYPNKKNPTSQHVKLKNKKQFFKDFDDDTNNTNTKVETEEEKLSYNLYQLTRAKNLNITEFGNKYFEYKFAYKTEPTHKSKSLLYYSFLYENDLTFNYLLQNSEFARAEIKNNIHFLFSNKNPDILKSCLNHFDFEHLDSQTSDNLFKNIAQHVFRLENTFYLLEKFENLNINQKQEFISAIFEYNNIPMLKSINQFSNLKALAVTYLEIHKDNLQIKNYELIYKNIFQEKLNEYYFFPKNSLFEDIKIEFNTLLQNKKNNLHPTKDNVSNNHIDNEIKTSKTVTITKKTILKKMKP